MQVHIQELKAVRKPHHSYTFRKQQFFLGVFRTLGFYFGCLYSSKSQNFQKNLCLGMNLLFTLRRYVLSLSKLC